MTSNQIDGNNVQYFHDERPISPIPYLQPALNPQIAELSNSSTSQRLRSLNDKIEQQTSGQNKEKVSLFHSGQMHGTNLENINQGLQGFGSSPRRQSRLISKFEKRNPSNKIPLEMSFDDSAQDHQFESFSDFRNSPKVTFTRKLDTVDNEENLSSSSESDYKPVKIRGKSSKNVKVKVKRHKGLKKKVSFQKLPKSGVKKSRKPKKTSSGPRSQKDLAQLIDNSRVFLDSPKHFLGTNFEFNPSTSQLPSNQNLQNSLNFSPSRVSLHQLNQATAMKNNLSLSQSRIQIGKMVKTQRIREMGDSYNLSPIHKNRGKPTFDMKSLQKKFDDTLRVKYTNLKQLHQDMEKNVILEQDSNSSGTKYHKKYRNTKAINLQKMDSNAPSALTSPCQSKYGSYKSIPNIFTGEEQTFEIGNVKRSNSNSKSRSRSHKRARRNSKVRRFQKKSENNNWNSRKQLRRLADQVVERFQQEIPESYKQIGGSDGNELEEFQESFNQFLETQKQKFITGYIYNHSRQASRASNSPQMSHKHRSNRNSTILEVNESTPKHQENTPFFGKRHGSTDNLHQSQPAYQTNAFVPEIRHSVNFSVMNSSNIEVQKIRFSNQEATRQRLIKPKRNRNLNFFEVKNNSRETNKFVGRTSARSLDQVLKNSPYKNNFSRQGSQTSFKKRQHSSKQSPNYKVRLKSKNKYRKRKIRTRPFSPGLQYFTRVKSKEGKTLKRIGSQGSLGRKGSPKNRRKKSRSRTRKFIGLKDVMRQTKKSPPIQKLNFLKKTSPVDQLKLDGFNKKLVVESGSSHRHHPFA